ncbi:MAG: glycerol-3-phosphate 1-O-acyltransferase PlsY [Aestuariivirga sp.]
MGGNLLALVIGYLAGSIPFGLLLARAAGLGDIRQIGSGNIGATNVLRTGNKSIAAATLICDVLKGLLPCLVANRFWGETAMLLAGFAAMAGHIFPVWLGFKGGKGVATVAGVLFAWCWPIGLAALLTWIGVFYERRISSLSALCATITALSTCWLWAPHLLWAVAIMVLIVIFTHRANISRLIAGTEPQSTFTKKS